jgi:hypothetical protein
MDAEILGALYPTMPAQPPGQEATAHTPSSDEEIAAAFYPGEPGPVQLEAVSPEVRALRDDPARLMYKADPLEGLNQEDLADIGPEDRAEVAELLTDLGLGQRDVAEMVTRASRLQADPAPQESLQEASIRALNAKFGHDAAQALRDARLLISRDQRAAELFDRLGVGDDPDTVVRLAEEARRQLLAGKLRRPGASVVSGHLN